MPDYLRALVFVLALGGLTFAVTIKPLSVLAGRQRILAWCGIWLALTVCFFLTRNFWLILLVSAVILLISMKWEDDKTVLYLLAFCMAPVVVITMPGFGGIKQSCGVHLSGFFGSPVARSGSAFKQRARKVEFSNAAKALLFVYFALVSILTFRETTVTNTLRTSFGLALSMLVPFLAFSTLVNTEGKMKGAIHAMIFAAVSLALVGVFEFFKQWHVYDPAFAVVGKRKLFASWRRAQGIRDPCFIPSHLAPCLWSASGSASQFRRSYCPQDNGQFWSRCLSAA